MRDFHDRIEHAIDVFRQTNRHNIFIGLNHADWDELCAVLMEKIGSSHQDPTLTRNSYGGIPIVMLGDSQKSFIGHDHGCRAERRFPLEALASLAMTPA